MFIRQLNYLVALSKEQHFTRAAERCHVSQPALSGAIRNLEEELGVPIVQRGHNFMGFTPEGQRVLLWAQQILSDWGSLKQDITLNSEKLVGTLRIGAIPTTLPIVAMLTAQCLPHFPGIKHQVLSLSTEQIIRRLDTFELDVALSYLDDESLQGFRVLPLYQEHYVLLAPSQSEFACRDSVNWSELNNLPLCMLASNMRNRRIIDAALRRAEVQPDVQVETDSILSLYAHIYHARLCSIVPHSLLSLNSLHAGLTTVPLSPSLLRPIGLITTNREPLSPLVSAVWPLFEGIDIQQQLDAITDGH